MREEGLLLRRVRPGAAVHVVRAERDAGELGVRVRVLFGEAAAGQDTDAAAVDCLGEAARRPLQRVRPAGLDRSRQIHDIRGILCPSRKAVY